MTDTSYTWFDPAGRRPEQGRLERQAALYDPITRHVLDAAGLRKGMRVLDLGSGAGDVAIMASRMVGDHGRVLGIDSNPDAVVSASERVAGAGLRNITFEQGDIADLRTPGSFDAVIGRLVLMYLPDPVRVVRDVAALVAPEGVVVFLEISWDHLATPETPLYAEVARIIGAAFERTGAHMNMGERLHATFVAAGLGPPVLSYERPVGGSERPLTQYLRDELVGLAPLLEREGLADRAELGLDTLVSRLDADTDRTGGIVTLWPMIGAWARRR